ncbi:DUF1796 family putative cysteine peptidase [Methylobacterium sp. Leaf466]|uniref:DUF1796 family putative cysteine peptidase n=1 Tax=Methylobacterium sp. Leaf466 TaxID=1736386 RepID=UPI0006F6305C|nr:DUF1796 family putative cysteine peptidase [Methylobacterium sp. Leaf466]KQT87593.1 peptidase [Methylobacterium sp. Leaf466]
MRLSLGSLLRRRTERAPDTREPGALNHVSLGSHCHMAQILKDSGLRTWSGPFDWIFSVPGMVRDCLSDDFALLLDRRQHETTRPEERPKPGEFLGRHRIYCQRHRIPFVFNHHDPAGNDVDYAFLERGVERLRRALDTPGTENRFYLMTAMPVREAALMQLCDLLARRASRNHLTLLEVAPGQAAAAVERVEQPRADLTRLRVATRSVSTGIRFRDPADDVFVANLLRG